MIFTLALNMLVLLITPFLIGLSYIQLPLPTALATAFALVFRYLWALNGILPIDTLFIVLGAAFLFQLAVAAFQITSWFFMIGRSIVFKR